MQKISLFQLFVFEILGSRNQIDHTHFWSFLLKKIPEFIFLIGINIQKIRLFH